MINCKDEVYRVFQQTWGCIHKAPKENLKLKWKFQMHISNLFSIILQWNFACLWKTTFFISMQSFIEVLWVKIEKSAFEIFTQIWDFPKELCEYGPRCCLSRRHLMRVFIFTRKHNIKLGFWKSSYTFFVIHSLLFVWI